MAQNGGRIEFQVGVREDQSSFKQLRQSLEQLSKIKLADFQGSEQELKQLKSTANEVQQALTKAFNVNLNSVNVTKFNEQIKGTVGSIDKIYSSFSKAGAQGQAAFSKMAQSVLTTNLQLKETTSLLDSMGTTMVNTVKWGVASSVMNTFTSSVQSAFSYVESLEKSLTDIRIVTGDSTQKMEQFAVQANKAAQALGRSTMDYTKSALTFYQQGLNDEAVAARTEAVLKAQNITGAGQEMADYLTSVWNGYKVANEEAELYVDKLAAVADSSASNMSQLAIAMSKVASTANDMGVDADQLNAQLATVIATTRQAPEAVGTAFKTIYTRLNDIKVGSDEAEISLGNYSGAMAKLGFNVLDASGHLRDTGQVIEEIGESWGDLSREQQVFLARMMGGQRQINMVMSLFSNWNTYTKLLNTSLQSEGTLMEKNGRYMESLGAKMEQLGAAGERVKNSLIDSDSFKAVIELLTSATNLFGTFIESIGGGGNALLSLGSIATQVFGESIARQINAHIINLQSVKSNLKEIEEAEKRVAQQGENSFNRGLTRLYVNDLKELHSVWSGLTNQQKVEQQERAKQISSLRAQAAVLRENQQQAQKFAQVLTGQHRDFSGSGSQRIKNMLQNIRQKVVQANSAYNDFTNHILEETVDPTPMRNLADSVSRLVRSLGNSATQDQRNFAIYLDQIATKGKQASLDFTELDTVLTKLFETTNNKTNKLDFLIIPEESKRGVKQVEQDLSKTKETFKNVNEEAKQFNSIKSFSNAIAAVGQLASGFNILSNTINNVWTDKNLSASEKALKITMGIATALPMLINGYTLLKDSTASLSALLLTQTINTQGATVAQWSLNEAFAANPIGVVTIAIMGLIAAFAALQKAYDYFTISTKQATQAVEKFNEKQKEFSSNEKTTKQNISNLQDLRKEYQKLSEKAGANNLDSTIDSLTQEERARYNQIKDLVASYNEDAIAGYNDQGQAILINNKALEETIELLKEKHQLEIEETYGGKEYKDAYAGRRKLYNDQKDKGYQSNLLTPDLSQASLWAVSGLESLEKSGVSFNTQIEKITEIQKDGIQNIASHNEDLNKVYDDFISKIQNNRDKFSDAEIQGVKNRIDRLREISDNYVKQDFNREKFNKELEENAKIPIDEILGFIQTQGQNKEYNQLAQEYGEATLNSIISNYVQGVNNGQGFTIDKYIDPEQYARAIKDGLFRPLLEFGLTSDDISQITKAAESFSKVVPALTVSQYEQGIEEITTGIYQSNENIKKLADENPEAFSNLIASLFGFDSVNFEIEDGKVKAAQDSFVNAYRKIYDETKEKIAGLNLTPTEEKVLTDYIDHANTYSLQNFDSLLEKIGEDAEITTDSLGKAAKELNDINSLETSTVAFDLLNQRDSGSKLSEAQTEILQKELEDLGSIYPELTDKIEILNREQLNGTTEYEKALFTLKATIVDTFASVGDYSESSMGQLSNLVNSMEDLQLVVKQNPKLFEGQNQETGINWVAQQLEKLALKYESCTDQLNRYLQAREQGNKEEQAAAQFQLQLAIRAEQNAAQYGIAADRISELSKHYVELAQAGEKGYEGLDKNSELASDAAVRYLRLNDSLTDLYDNLDNYKQVLEEAKEGGLEAVLSNEQLSASFNKIKEDIAGVVDTSSDFISSEWIADNMQLIIDAAQGGQDAIRRLQAAAAEEVIVNMGVDLSALDTSAQEVANWAANLPTGSLDVDDTIFLQKLVLAMQNAGWAQSEIESALSGIGIDLDLNPYEQGLNKVIDEAMDAGKLASDAFASNAGVDAKTKTQQETSVDKFQTPSTKVTWTSNPSSFTYPQAQYSTTDDGQPVVEYNQETMEIDYPTLTAEPTNESLDQQKQTSATALQVVGAKKSSGGKISHYNTPSARKARSSNKKSSSGSKKSSPKKSSKRKTPKYSSRKTAAPKKKKTSTKKEKEKEEKQKDPQKLEKIEEEKDRYHDINIQITKIQTGLKNVQQQQKKLNGKDLSDNLNKQVEILKQQVGLYKQKIELAKGEQKQLQNTLRGYGVQFYTDGTIANYAEVLNKQLDKVNDTIEYYNSLSAQQQQNYKDDVDKAKERYEKLKDLIARYDKLYSEEIPGLEESVRSAIDKQVELQIENFKINVELDIDFSEATREWNKFKKQIIDQVRDDDIPGIVRSQIDDIFTYYPDSKDRTGLIPSLTNQVNDTLAQLQRMNSGQWSNIYGDNKAQALEDLKNYSSQLMKSLQDYDNLIKDIKKSFFDMVNRAQDAFDEQTKEYDFLSDLIDHDKKLIEMLYGDKAYNMISNYYQKQEEVDKRELQFQRQQKDFWYAQMQAQKARMDTLDKESNEYKEVEERFKELEEHWLSAVSDFNSKVEESINNLLDQYKNNVSIIFDDLNNKLTGGKGMDYLNQEWELINQNADMYLDKINSMYEIEKLQQAYEDAIADTGDDVSAQKSLNQMMNQQLKYLRQKDKLTQYDVDRANLLLQLETKRLALEQARQNKTKLRLRRDTQGNYTYQYVADENQTNQAQRGLSQVQNSLYNLDKNEYKNNLNTIYSLQDNFNNKMQELYNQYPIWTEQAERKRRLLVEQYGQAINSVVDQNEQIRLNLTESAFTQLAKMYDADVTTFMNMSQTEKDELMYGLVPQWKSGIQQMAETFKGAGGFIPACKEGFVELDEATGDYQAKLDELEKTAGVNFENISNGIDTDITKTQKLLENNDALIDSYKSEMETVDGLIKKVEELSKAYTSAKQEAIAAAKAVQDYLDAQNKKKQSQTKTINAPDSTSSNNKTHIIDTSASSTGTSSSTGSGSGKNTYSDSFKSKYSNTFKGTGYSNSWVGYSESFEKAISLEEGIAAAILLDGSKSGWDPQRHNKLIKRLDPTGANKVESYIAKNSKEIIDAWKNKKDKLKLYYYSSPSFDTGGYTGSWGSSGKLGILHEKELVLNKRDTANLLSAVNVVRTMDDLLKGISGNVGSVNSFSSLARMGGSKGLLDQNVHITATFPNVSSHGEIEKAFDNLINRASQYAFSKR